MKDEIFPLSQTKAGKEVILMAITGGRLLRHRLLSMGLKQGARLKVLHSHRPGPCLVLTGNTRLALGHGMAQQILVKATD